MSGSPSRALRLGAVSAAVYSKTFVTRCGPVTFVADSRDSPIRPASEVDRLRMELALAKNEIDELWNLVPNATARLTFADLEAGLLERRRANRQRSAQGAQARKTQRDAARRKAIGEAARAMKRRNPSLSASQIATNLARDGVTFVVAGEPKAEHRIDREFVGEELRRNPRA